MITINSYLSIRSVCKAPPMTVPSTDAQSDMYYVKMLCSSGIKGDSYPRLCFLHKFCFQVDYSFIRDLKG